MKLNLSALIKETATDVDKQMESQAVHLQVGTKVRDWVRQWEGMDTTEIRAFMNDRSVKGIPRDARNCVFARFLQDETGKTIAVADSVMVELTDPYAAPRTVSIVPTSMRLFMRHFDQGQFPELIIPSHRHNNPFPNLTVHADGSAFAQVKWQYQYFTSAQAMKLDFTNGDTLKFDLTTT